MFDGRRYSGKASRSNRGRVDGLKQLFSDFCLEEGEAFQVNYVEADHTIYLNRN